ncbi:hypothetical protein SAMN05892877_103384 [Rhizobium subbaraonis]|uniref:Uncharacterized protein n=1 Tax=Rhizobium subbaraonis TaxID=908946 RepID=A0A285U524_9HYPH|nr:hypothetical protein [Rhizobium subbaraonis]SOC37040.1 hypothetical protein SAMN05892877_103384 [Rhizobium subbaraonis]
MSELTQGQEQLCQQSAGLVTAFEALSTGADSLAVDLALATVFGRRAAASGCHFSTSFAMFKVASFEAFLEARREARRG